MNKALAIIEEIMAEVFQKWQKYQKVLEIPRRTNTKKTIPKCLIIILLKNNDQEKILKSTRRKYISPSTEQH